MSFPQIERLLQLDELIRSSQRHTQASLAQALEVSDRTIRTYIDFMRGLAKRGTSWSAFAGAARSPECS